MAGTCNRSGGGHPPVPPVIRALVLISQRSKFLNIDKVMYVEDYRVLLYFRLSVHDKSANNSSHSSLVDLEIVGGGCGRSRKAEGR